MFTFDDLGGRSVTLRPEGTAPIARAYLEHGMHKLPQPVKLWHLGPYFRYERPQAGRFRQFNQIGAEAIGSDSPLVDAELIMLLDELLRGLGVPALGCGSQPRLARGAGRLPRGARGLPARARGRAGADVRERIDENPLRAFDSKDEGTRAVMAEAPTMLDRLEGEDAEHFEAVRRLLDEAGIAYELDGTLVRGLDYYTRTVFEFTCERSARSRRSAAAGATTG